MQNCKISNYPGLIFLVIVLLTINIGQVKGVPSYARQTGLSCAACHFSFPELNSFGREFKMNGYALPNSSTLEGKADRNGKLTGSLPLSASIQSSFTNISKDIPKVQNNSVALPQQLSLFYAGQVTPHIGTFIQMSYDGHKFGMDNIDIRYSDHASILNKKIVYGVTLNNNPTVQDVWNNLPAWRFPQASSDASNTPAKSAVIENLGSQVAGLGGYMLFNNFIFTEVTVYRSAQQGSFVNPSNSQSTMVVDGVAPYWRLALQHQWGKNYAELGTFGFAPKIYASGITGYLKKFTDLGVDLQYEHNFNFGATTIHASFIQEKEIREVTKVLSNSLNFNSYKFDANLYMKNGIGVTAGFFYSEGSVDSKVISWSNKPDSFGYIGQLEYLPWNNTKIALQYVLYEKFDGTIWNYDSKKRTAADNNSLCMMVWLNF